MENYTDEVVTKLLERFKTQELRICKLEYQIKSLNSELKRSAEIERLIRQFGGSND